MVITSIATLLILFIGLQILFYLGTGFHIVNDNTNLGNLVNEEIPAFTIILINKVLERIITKLTSYEIHETWTAFLAAVIRKLSLSESISLGFLLYIIHPDKNY